VTSYEIGGCLSTLLADDARMQELTADDGEEVRVWKCALLRLAAALGGIAAAQRETAWRFDPDNESAGGFRKDVLLAAYWYEMAAKKGDGLAANNLAVFFASGDETHHDCRKAVHYFDVAARGRSGGGRVSAQVQEVPREQGVPSRPIIMGRLG